MEKKTAKFRKMEKREVGGAVMEEWKKKKEMV